MSGKRAKALRKAQRAQGIEPRLDRERREAIEELERLQAHSAARERFRRDHPERAAQQEQEALRRLAALSGIITGAMLCMIATAQAPEVRP